MYKNLNNKFLNIYILWIAAILFPYQIVGKIYYIYFMILSIYIYYKYFTNKKYLFAINNNVSIFILLFILISIITTLININNVGINNFILLLSTINVGVLIYLSAKLYGANSIRNFLYKIKIIGNILAIIGIKQYITRSAITEKFFASQNLINQYMELRGYNANRLHNVFEHYIVYGAFLICIFWLNIFLNKNKSKIKPMIINIIILFNIYGTQARSTWIALACTILLYLFIKSKELTKKNKKIHRKTLIYAPISISILIILLILFNEQIFNFIFSIFERFNNMNTVDGSIAKEQRLFIIFFILNYIINGNLINMFIGYGYRASEILMINTKTLISNFKTTDNQWISFIFDFGIISVILYILFIILNIKNIALMKKDNEFYDIKISALFIVVSNSINMFFYETFRFKSIFIIFLTAIVILCCKFKNETSK